MAETGNKAEVKSAAKQEAKTVSKPEAKTETKTETKHDKFKRLASQRVSSALGKIELVGNLSSSGYEYTPEEVGKIFSSLQQTLDAAKARFSKSKREEPKKFVL